eukprot:GEMP01030207.1.p1 GENE.GEMP01030207.1~~GEMP01030207.1.p1  ORF type:complete len:431 (+),score=60.11 GEMP01030207.1:139-1431(+)
MSWGTSRGNVAPQQMGIAQEPGDDNQDEVDHALLPHDIEIGSHNSNENKRWAIAVPRQRMPFMSIALLLVALGLYAFAKAPYSFFRTRSKGWIPLLRHLNVEQMGDFFLEHLVLNEYGRSIAAHAHNFGDSRPQLTTMIISRMRPGNISYLPVGLWFFERAVKVSGMFDWEVVVCNTDYDDLPRPSLFDRVQRELNVTVLNVQDRRLIRHRPLTRTRPSPMEGKKDYGGCLTLLGEHLKSKENNAPYVVVLEDDTIVLDNFETSINWMLARPEFRSKETGYVKLWHPRNFIRYVFLFPVLAFNAIISLIVVVLMRRTRLRWCTAFSCGATTFGALYVVYLWLHDHTLSLLMTLVPLMHDLEHANSCCTPGMMYDANLLSVLGERMETDTGVLPYDLLMYDVVFMEMHRLVQQLYPFAVEHIGHVSTMNNL